MRGFVLKGSMEWLNIHKSILDSQEMRMADPQDRGTWLLLMAYCIGQENGGTITGCGYWTEKLWLSIVGVAPSEIERPTTLWHRDGQSLIVAHYPKEKEQLVRNRREIGRLGGMSHSEAKAEAARANGLMRASQAKAKQKPSNNPTEGKGREGKGKE